MNKADLVRAVASDASLDAAQARKAVDAVLKAIEGALGDGQDVTLTGFGKFSVVERAARTGVNPRDPGSRITIPARRAPRFTPGTELKRAVAGPDGRPDAVKMMAGEPEATTRSKSRRSSASAASSSSSASRAASGKGAAKKSSAKGAAKASGSSAGRRSGSKRAKE